MRIPCPHCGARDAARSSPISATPPSRARIADPSATRAPGSTTSICATTRRGRISEHWYHGAGCRAWLVVDAQHAHPRDRRRRRSPRSKAGARAMSSQPFRLAAGGLIDRRQPLRFTLRRQDAHRLCRRHAGLGAARQRRPPGRPLVQVSSPARHPDGRLRGAERAGRAAQRRAARAEHPRDDRRAL